MLSTCAHPRASGGTPERRTAQARWRTVIHGPTGCGYGGTAAFVAPTRWRAGIEGCASTQTTPAPWCARAGACAYHASPGRAFATPCGADEGGHDWWRQGVRWSSGTPRWRGRGERAAPSPGAMATGARVSPCQRGHTFPCAVGGVPAAADGLGEAAVRPVWRLVGPGRGVAPTHLGPFGHWRLVPRDGILGLRSWPGDMPPTPWRGVVRELACDHYARTCGMVQVGTSGVIMASST